MPSKSMIAQEHENDDDEEHENLMEWPESKIGMFFHVLLLPLKAAMYARVLHCILCTLPCSPCIGPLRRSYRYYTISDVRKPENEDKFGQAIIMSVFYLALFSFIMTDCMEQLGPLVNIDDFIMGVVFAAAGTSFPNVFASMVVARQGLGNAAISNALGSSFSAPCGSPLAVHHKFVSSLPAPSHAGGNVFNIFMGLGLPWLLYTFVGPEFVDHENFIYFGLEAGGIIVPVLLLVSVLMIFLLILMCTGWELYTSHAHGGIVFYLFFLVWVFTTKMKQPSL